MIGIIIGIIVCIILYSLWVKFWKKFRFKILYTIGYWVLFGVGSDFYLSNTYSSYAAYLDISSTSIILAIIIFIVGLCLVNVVEDAICFGNPFNAICIIVAFTLLAIGFIKRSLDDESILFMIILTVGVVVIYMLIRNLTYESRVKQYTLNYVGLRVFGNNRRDWVTESSFFSQPRVIGFLLEKTTFNNMDNKSYLKDTLKRCMLGMIENKLKVELKKSGDRIFFFYEYCAYYAYLDEQNMDLISILESFDSINMKFVYVENDEGDGAFFSVNILNQISSNFIPFLKQMPKLSGVPFSKDYLVNTMHSNGFLSPYITKEFWDSLENDFELYKGDFILLYDAIANEEISTARNNQMLMDAPRYNKKDEATYILNHADENGIIEEEFGIELEDYRVAFDIDVNENELVGCPA